MNKINKKSFWKRANRGFIVSMALVFIVVVYIVVTQISIIPQKNKIKDIMEKYSDLFEKSVLAQTDQNYSSESFDAVKKDIEGLFMSNSEYLNIAASYIASNQRPEGEQITEVGNKKSVKRKINIEENTCRFDLSYIVKVSGKFNDYQSGLGELKDYTDIDQIIGVSAILKKVDGEWKIYRIISAFSYADTYGKNTVRIDRVG